MLWLKGVDFNVNGYNYGVVASIVMANAGTCMTDNPHQNVTVVKFISHSSSVRAFFSPA